MPGLARAIRTCIGIIDDVLVTGGIPVDIVHRAFVAQDALGDGEPYAAPVTRHAVLSATSHRFHGMGGYETQNQGRLLFVGPVVFTTNDQVTMPDGSMSPILEVKGLWDPAAAGRYYTIVTLGQESLPRQQFGI